MKPPDLTAVDAEQAVLGRAIATQRLDLHAKALSPADFGETRNGAVYGALVTLHIAARPIDLLTVSEQLRADGKLEVVGGLPYLMHLEQSAPLSDHAAAEHVAAVKDRAMRRALVARARELAAAARDLRQPAARTAHAAGQDFGRLATEGSTDADELGGVDVMALSERWADFAAGKSSPFLPTGLAALDEVFPGFLPNMNLIGGRASVGKTALVAEMIWHWLEDGKPGGIFGLEDGTAWLLERHVSRYLGIDLGLVGACRLHEEQMAMLQAFLGRAHHMLNTLLRVHRTSGLEAPDLVRKAERWISKGAKWLVIDHGGRIGHSSLNAKERYDLSIRRTCEALDNLAHNSGVPILVNWHFNREAAKREGAPTMEDFKESGYLEAFSGTMLGLWEHPAKPGCLLATVVKNRKGKRDVHVQMQRDARHGLVHRIGGRVFTVSELEPEKPVTQKKGFKLFGSEAQP